MSYKTKVVNNNYYTDIVNFVREAQDVVGDITVKKGKYVVDGKSLMGVMSINMATGVTIEYPAAAANFENFISTFAE